jgi:hypothetical protein
MCCSIVWLYWIQSETEHNVKFPWIFIVQSFKLLIDLPIKTPDWLPPPSDRYSGIQHAVFGDPSTSRSKANLVQVFPIPLTHVVFFFSLFFKWKFILSMAQEDMKHDSGIQIQVVDWRYRIVSISFLLDIDFQLVGVVTISLLVEDLSNLHYNFNREPLIDLRSGMGWISFIF